VTSGKRRRSPGELRIPRSSGLPAVAVNYTKLVLRSVSIAAMASQVAYQLGLFIGDARWPARVGMDTIVALSQRVHDVNQEYAALAFMLRES